jgi:hypothetical protein
MNDIHVARDAHGHDREFLGRLVRMEWVRWAREQSDPKLHWLEPWDALDEPMREVDRRIGERVASVAVAMMQRDLERAENEAAVLRARLASAERGQ